MKPMGMAGALVSHFPEMKKHKERAEDIDIEVSVYPVNKADSEMYKQEYKHLDAERKRLKIILESWNPDLVSSKARKKTEDELKRLTMRMRELRKEL